MSTEKMREDFNHWYDKERKKAAPFSTVNIRDKCFEAWQASRAAIEVDLTSPHNDYSISDRDVNGACEQWRRDKSAIESHGLRVKS